MAEDPSGRYYPKPFRLLSNTVETSLEMHAVQQDIVIPNENVVAADTKKPAKSPEDADNKDEPDNKNKDEENMAVDS